jgi:anhydro-N-acetylmuramic acid kinase
MTASLYIGLMSGTSLDGVDGVLVDFSASPWRVLAHQSLALPAELKAELLALNQSGDDELHRAALAANDLVRVYAQVVKRLLEDQHLKAQDIRAIGAHGQTVRHRPGLFDATGYTLQLNNPALLAELTRISVIADFRSRDVAAGGQGAPLVPVFHQHMFGDATHAQAVLNLGGIANLSVLRPNGDLLGFDCGPANALLDHWCQQHTGQDFDHSGQWAQSGVVHEALLHQLMQEPFLQQPPPKSTGRDLFHPEWLHAHLQAFDALPAADVQATLTEFTARACAQDVARHASDAQRLIVCGGGALNHFLMARLQAGLAMPVVSSQTCGMPPLQVEACAFAWLAHQTLLGLPGNSPKVTGAQGARILGGIYPA